MVQNKKAAGQACARMRNGWVGSFASERPSLGAVGLHKSRNHASWVSQAFRRKFN
jgi:hypothetical protein